MALLDNANTFNLLAPQLLERLGPEPVEILSLDLAGHGLSSHRRNQDYWIWRDLDEANEIAQQMGWDRHAVMGHSMGGAVASFYAGLFPENNRSFWPIHNSPRRRARSVTEVILQDERTADEATTLLPFDRIGNSSTTSIGQWPVNKLPVTVLAPRSLVPVEKTDEHGKIIQGVTWRSDPILTFQIPTRASNAYGEAFMRRITCPFLAFLVTHGFRTRFDVDERLKWLRNASIVTEYTVEGSHHVHIDDPEMVAKMISAWIIEQDSSVKARL